MDKISPIKERILQYIDNKGITKTDFCENTGISYQNMKGKSLFSEIGGSQIAKILSVYPEISSEWILTGNGEMLKNSNEVEINSTAKEPEAKYTTCASCKSKDKLIITLEHKTVRDEEQIERLWKQIEYLTKTRI